jgi:predicted nucleic acid-binding protein
LGKPSSVPYPAFGLFGLLQPLALAQAHAGAPAILVDEFDAGHLKEHRNSRILPIDRAVANEWGRLNANRPLPVIDGLLATAKIHRLTLVTRNTADIADLDVPILNPFELR